MKIAIVAAVIVIIGILGCCTSFFFLSKAAEKSDELAEQELQECLKNAEATYHVNWNNQCYSRGYQRNCQLTTDIASMVEDRYQNDKNSCYSD